MSAPEFTLFDTRDRPLRHRLGRARRAVHSCCRKAREDRDARADCEAVPGCATGRAAGERCSARSTTIVALLRGQPRDLSDIVLDMDGVPPFHQRVYAVARTIPPGATLTYGEIATQLGDRGAARAVGQALGRNPFPIIVPCHRVLAAGGKVGGFSANGGITTKLRLLTIEGAHAEPQRNLFDGDGKYGFDPDGGDRTSEAARSAARRARSNASAHYDLELRSTPSIFVALAEAIVYQQLNGHAAATIFARVRALFPQRAPRPDAGTDPARARREAARRGPLASENAVAAGPRGSARSAAKFRRWPKRTRLTDAELIERLTHVRGIGRWTVEMLLISRLGRPDVLPADDFGIRKGFAKALNKREMPTPKEVIARGAKWAPYRTVASWYLWRAAE